MKNKKYHTVRTVPKYHTVRTVPKYHTTEQFRNTTLSEQFRNTTLSEQFRNTTLSEQFRNLTDKSLKQRHGRYMKHIYITRPTEKGGWCQTDGTPGPMSYNQGFRQINK
jgi:predicted restriction endonuclease